MDRDPGEPLYERMEAHATLEHKRRLATVSSADVTVTELAGDRIRAVLTHAPGNDASIGGLKVTTDSGWFAARPSGTEPVHKIYAESFRGAGHLRRVLQDAQTIVGDVLATPQGAARRPAPGTTVSGTSTP